MSRILTLLLLFHWGVTFALLAGFCVFGGEEGTRNGFGFFGLTLSGDDYLVASFPAVKTAVAFGLSICAVLFWWSLLTMLGRADRAAADEVIRMAFASACCLMTLLLLVGAIKTPDGLFSAMAAHFAALMASFVAIGLERNAGERRRAANDLLPSAARVRAIEASQAFRLSRFVVSYDNSRGSER